MYFCFVTVLMVICSAQTDFIGFTLTRQRGCDGQNSDTYSSITLQNCYEACLNSIGCKSFEYFTYHTYDKTTVCQLSTTCTLNQTVDQGDHYGPLYFYSLDETTTTQAPNTPPDFIGFTQTSGRGCDEQNWEVFSDITFQKCYEACVGLSGCKSFEYFTNHTYEKITVCHTSKTCTLDQTEDQKGAYGPVYFYSLDETTTTQSPGESTELPSESTELPSESTQSWIRKEQNRYHCNDGYEEAANPDYCQACDGGYVGTSGKCDIKCDWAHEPNDKRDECALSMTIEWVIILCSIGPVIFGVITFFYTKEKELCCFKTPTKIMTNSVSQMTTTGS